MSNKTNAQNTAAKSVEAQSADVLNETTDETVAVEVVVAPSKLQAAKRLQRSFNYESLAVSTAIAGVGSVCSMLASNQIADNLDADTQRFSMGDMAIIAGTAMTLAAGVNTGLQFASDRFRANDNISLLVTSLSGNGALLGTAFFGNKLLQLVKGQTVSVTDMLTEEEIAEA